MSVEHFAHPEWLGALLAALLVASVAVAAARRSARRRRRALLGAAPDTVARALASDVALLVALACVAVALLGPRLGERVVRVSSSGVDVVFALDVSRSMDAPDVPPSRLDRARRGVAALIERLEPRDRVAVAAFAGRGVLLTPLTPDHQAVVDLLPVIDTELVRPASSDLARGLSAALEAFELASERPRVVFLLSDGEDSRRGRGLDTARAVRAGVRVLAAAIGSEAGSRVPDHGAPLLDANGDVVVSRRDAARLGRVAEQTGGALFVADAWGDFDFDAAAAAIRRDAAAAPGEPVERRVLAVRVFPFAAAAFALLLAEGLPRPRRAGAVLAGSAAAGLLLGAGAAEPPDARRLIRLGVERLERGERDAAGRAFLAAALSARDPDVAALAYYDLGVTALETGDLEAARDAFFDALALAPGDRRARFNLEWSIDALTRHAPPPRHRPRARPPEPPRENEQDEPAEQEREEPTRPSAEREPEPEVPVAEPPPPRLDARQRQLWLDRVRDDPTRSIRSALERREDAPRRVEGPAW